MVENETHTITPFEGFPKTKIESDCTDGAAVKHVVEPMFMTPLRAKIADRLSVCLAAGAAGGSLYAGFAFDISPMIYLGSFFVAPLPSFFGCRFILHKIIRRSSRVVFTPEQFIHFGFWKTKTYDRNIPHSFSLYFHDKKDREEERLSFKESKRSRRWWAWSPKRYLGKSYYISFEYMGQRNDLMLVYTRKIANQILARLNACDEVMDGHAGNGRGQALAPQDEWPDQTGGLDFAEV